MERYKNIYDYFGFRKQMKKLDEECYELIEAVYDYEHDKTNKNRYHVIEEMSDCLTLLTQIIAKYDILKSDIDVFMDYKLARTEERIENNYYDKNHK